MSKLKTSNPILLLLTLVMVIGTIAGCSGEKVPTAGQEPGTRTIVDMTGKSVTIPAVDKIERVAVLTSPQVQIMYILGVQDKLCAMTASQHRYKLFEKFYPRQANIPAPRKQAADINVEALLNTNPQFCMGSETDMDLVDKDAKLTLKPMSVTTCISVCCGGVSISALLPALLSALRSGCAAT
ncbi:MAG: hypothetical protein K6T65_12215 [Peptococcaceae bacterium]|nr:hypothetical protein [Peptococcaceae bacterium]